MNVSLQKHGAKHIYKVPEGLRELCADIAREVLRSQPRNIYCFIADYVEALLITRENTKVAVKVVNNILLGSQAIVSILYRSGLSLEQIARAAPRIQKAFRAYLDAVDMRAAQVCDDATCDQESKVSLQGILQATGVSLKQAEESATIIQAAFRGHYERMLLNESQGMIQWQRAATRTLEILRKAGTSQAEASKAAILIQATYRGYYTRRNLKMKMMAAREPKEDEEEDKEDEALQEDIIEPKKTIQAVDTMSEELGLMRANEAASVIQKAYRQYRQRKNSYNMPRVESTQSMEEALKNMQQKASDKLTNTDIPEEFEDLRAGNGEPARVEEPEEWSAKLADNATYLNGKAEDRKEGREIEVESEPVADEPINMEAAGERCEKRNETTRAQRAQRAAASKKLPPEAAECRRHTAAFNAHAYAR